MLNEVRLIGRLGADPEIRKTGNGKPVASLRVATWKNYWNEQKKEWETISEWHSVVCWGDQVSQAIKKMGKGDLVLISGELKTREWTDKQGVERYTTEIHGTAKALHKAREKAGAEQSSAQTAPAPSDGSDDDGDLPF